MIDPVHDEPAPPEVRARALEALAAGQIVALPTETVYGLAVRADDPEALKRLATCKGRADEQCLTQVVADGQILEDLPELGPLARRLGERYWPGPLTLVVRASDRSPQLLAPDGWQGLRVPAQNATRDLIAAAPFPIALTSANHHGEAPAVDAQQVEAAFGDSVAVIWDAGPTRLGEASGVLRLGRGSLEVLRPGLVDDDSLRRTAGWRIVFVCTGNTCRSPMAEGLARSLLTERLGGPLQEFGFEVSSMGVFGAPGSPASRDAVDVLSERGVDIAEHRSSPLINGLLADADEILCLTRSHADALLSVLAPRHAGRVRLIIPSGEDVPDPIGQGVDVYRHTADVIERAIRERLDDWA